MARTALRNRVGAVAVWLLASVVMATAGQANPDPGQQRPEPTAAASSPTVVLAPHVRGIKGSVYDAAQLVADARRACPTVRGLVETLELSDVIVFVEMRDGLSGPRAQLTFVGYRRGVRWLRVTIDARQRVSERIAFLAHELQHAAEVALAPDVRDVNGLRRLYERIGIDLGGGVFETETAIAVGNQALRETYAADRRCP